MTRTICAEFQPKSISALHWAFALPLSIAKWVGETLLRLRLRYQTTPDHVSDGGDFGNYFSELSASVNEPLCALADEVPAWLDREKFARGRAFAMRHILGLLYAEELSVVLLMSVPMLRGPLMFSGQSDTPDKAFRRYLSTVERVMTWYEQDIWDKDSTAHRNLMVVRGMHNRVLQAMKLCTWEQREEKMKPFECSGTSALLERLWADLEPYLPDEEHQKWMERFQSKDGPFINQCGMVFTQIGFVALLILEPGKFGAPGATQAELDDFVYVWYVLGHQLGIEDRYNICAGGLEATQRRCQLLIRHLVLPSLAAAGPDWEHMARCVVAGVHRMIRQPPFEAALAYSLAALGVPTPHINSLVPWRELPRLWLFKWVLCVLLGIPGVPDVMGVMLKTRLGRLRRRLDSTKSIPALT